MSKPLGSMLGTCHNAELLRPYALRWSMQQPELSMPMHQNLFFNFPPRWQQENSHVAIAQVCLVPGRAGSAVRDNTLSCGFVLGALPAVQHQAGDF